MANVKEGIKTDWGKFKNPEKKFYNRKVRIKVKKEIMRASESVSR